MTFGENLRKYRKIIGYTQIELAKKVGIAISTYQRYERDERSPNIKTIQKLASALKVTPDMLSGEDYSPRFMITRARKSLGLSQEEAAKRTGIDLDRYQKYESGEMALDNDTYFHIFDAFGLLNKDTPMYQRITQVPDSRKDIIQKIVNNLSKLDEDTLMKVLDYTGDMRKLPEHKAKLIVDFTVEERTPVDLSSIQSK